MMMRPKTADLMKLHELHKKKLKKAEKKDFTSPFNAAFTSIGEALDIKWSEYISFKESNPASKGEIFATLTEDSVTSLQSNLNSNESISLGMSDRQMKAVDSISNARKLFEYASKESLQPLTPDLILFKECIRNLIVPFFTKTQLTVSYNRMIS